MDSRIVAAGVIAAGVIAVTFITARITASGVLNPAGCMNVP
ncbi:MAG: hypothetical protein ACMUIL_05765 [bacterium]